jgi:hypothetical protein
VTRADWATSIGAFAAMFVLGLAIAYLVTS